MRLSEDPYELATDADALVICTDWNEFKQLDLSRIRDIMAHAVVVDGRNIYDPEAMHNLGFVYRGVGKGKTYTNGDA